MCLQRNNNGTLLKPEKSNKSVGQVNADSFKETDDNSIVAEQINNISTHDSSFYNMESHSTSLEDNQHSNISIHQNETIKNNQSVQGK